MRLARGILDDLGGEGHILLFRRNVKRDVKGRDALGHGNNLIVTAFGAWI